MFELFKLFWDVVVIRDGARKGYKLTRGNVFMAVGFVVLLYATGVPAAVLYQNHPQYKWVLIAALVFDGLLFIAMFTWEIKWYMKQRAARAAGSAPTNQPGQ
ncbi:MAG: hypothetical protein ABR865_12770, partial [Terracidiphilus sp.]